MLVPLHGAIACYMTGNYYGTIALSGLVCEMLSILIFEMHDIRVGMKKSLDVEKQKQLLGSTFERLGQERRTKVLHAFGIIKDEHLGRFERVRELRRQHLHFLTHSETLPKDAAECFHNALALAEMVFRAEFIDGAIARRPQLIRYLKTRM